MYQANVLRPFILRFIVIAFVFLPFGASAFDTIAKNLVVIDYKTGKALIAKNASQRMYPASMTKMMTAYLVFGALRSGRLKLTDKLPVSRTAWKQQGSKMFVNLGKMVSIKDLIQGLVVQSGNDAAIVLAEGLGGSQENFAAMMNKKAKELGMTGTHFMNPMGWPDEQHYTTAQDLATLARSLIDTFPEDYKYFSEKSFTYNKIRQGNRNPLLYRNMGVDGIKTGHTEASGFGLTASGVFENRRYIMVISGLPTKRSRLTESQRILSYVYRAYRPNILIKKGQKIGEAEVWLGKDETVPIVAKRTIAVLMPTSKFAEIKATVKRNQWLSSPVKVGDPAGFIEISVPGSKPIKVGLVAAKPVEKLTGFSRLTTLLRYQIVGG